MKLKLSLKKSSTAFLSFPCPVCGKVSNDNEFNHLCSECADQLQLIAQPYCCGCGGSNRGFLALCDKCIKGLDRPWEKIIAIYEYDYLAGKILRNLKYNTATHMVKCLMPEVLLRLTANNLKIDYVIPMPLHYTRLLSRGFNQSELLVLELIQQFKKSSDERVIKKYSHVKMVRLLSRKMRTRVQMTLDQDERLENMQGVFKVNERFVKKLNIPKNSNILLVDDILTTGATLKFATEALNEAGFQNINVLVFARR